MSKMARRGGQVEAVLAVLKYMFLGGAIMGLVGVLIAGAAAIFGGAGPLSLAYMTGIAWNYATIDLAGGAFTGLLYGLLTQGSNLKTAS